MQHQPILENLGLRVMTERPYGVRASDGRVYWIQEFTLIYALSHNIVLEKVKQEFEEAFARIWFGASESDCFNRLLLVEGDEIVDEVPTYRGEGQAFL